MDDLYALCRTTNQVLGFVAFCWAAYLSAWSWPAVWALPYHVWHYRTLLVISTAVALCASGTAYVVEHDPGASPATITSAGYTLLVLLVLTGCVMWPTPRRIARRLRREQSR